MRERAIFETERSDSIRFDSFLLIYDIFFRYLCGRSGEKHIPLSARSDLYIEVMAKKRGLYDAERLPIDVRHHLCRRVHKQ